MCSHVHREPATDADKEFFRRLNELSYRDVVTQQFGSWDEALQSRNFDLKWQDQAFEKVFDGDTLVGGIWVREFPDHFQIREIQILPEHRGRGAGTVILKQEIQRASKRRKPLRLRVLLLNRAKSLYDRLGFEEIGRDETHYYMEYPT